MVRYHQYLSPSRQLMDWDRRYFLSAIATMPVGVALAGCLGDDAESDLDAFDDQYFHHLASAAVQAGLTFESIGRDDDDWMELQLRTVVDLDEHIGDGGSDIEVPDPDHPSFQYFLVPPAYEELATAYADAVDAGESGTGLRVIYDDGRCTGVVVFQRSRAEWYLEAFLDEGTYLAEFRSNYSVECS